MNAKNEDDLSRNYENCSIRYILSERKYCFLLDWVYKEGKRFFNSSSLSTGKKGIEFACANGETLLITELQAPGKKRMKASDYLLGHPIKIED